MAHKSLTIEKLLAEFGTSLRLHLVTHESTRRQEITTSELYRPGLELSGFLNRFNPNRVLILGETEHSYLGSLDQETRTRRLQTIIEENVPVFVFSKNLPPFWEHIELCNEHQIPILISGLNTQKITTELKRILDIYFSERVRLHGTLVDVYGIGLLLMGDSGIGKSECALDLVERGHRLVTDDVVMIHRDAGYLIGEQVDFIGHIMEIHGIGFIDVSRLFGVRATRLSKRIETVVKFVAWKQGEEYNRTGLDQEHFEVLDVTVPKVTIPVNPGKNMAVICEVIALDQMLKDRGILVADEFNERIKSILVKKKTALDSVEVYIGDME